MRRLLNGFSLILCILPIIHNTEIVLAQTFVATPAVDIEVCDGFLGIGGCQQIYSERVDRDFAVQHFGTPLHAQKWAAAVHCTRVDPSEELCEHSVSIASDPEWNRIVWSKASSHSQAYGSWGKPADGPGHFHMPRGVDITHTSDFARHVAFVSDQLNNRIVVLVLKGAPLVTGVDWVGVIDGTESGLRLKGPFDVAWDHAQTWTRTDDRLFIADTGNDRVLAYNVAVDAANASMSVALIDTFGEPGSGPGELDSPRGIDVHSFKSGSTLYTDVYIADTGNNRVQHWNFDGASPSGSYSGSSLPIPGSELTGITTDAYGDVTVSDRSGERLLRLKRFSLDQLTTYGGSSQWVQGSFDAPAYVQTVYAYSQDGSDMSSQPIPYLITSERWSDDSGTQVHRLGADATDLAHFGSCGGSLNFKFTGAVDRYRVTVTGTGGTRVFPLQYNPPGGYYPSGSHSQQWDGADNQGQPMPSGQYTLKVYYETPYAYDDNDGRTTQTTFSYDCNFYVYASVPSYVTQKAWYALNGSATHSATNWEWETRTDSLSWYFWSDQEDTGWIAYAGEYVKDWRLTAESTQGGGTNFDIETTYVCTTGSCGGGGPPIEVVAGYGGDPNGEVPSPSIELSTATRSSVGPSSGPSLHFGSGVWVGQLNDGNAYVDRYYSLLGRHDTNMDEGAWPNLLERDSVSWVVSDAEEALSKRLSSRRTHWNDNVDVYAIAGELDTRRGRRAPITFALAADPDLGKPHDDELGFDESSELVWVRDEDSTYVGYAVLDAAPGSRVRVVQYGLGLGDEPPSRSKAHQELTKESNWAEGEKGDVRFLMTVDPVAVDETDRYDVHLAVLRAESQAELLKLLYDLRSSTDAILASLLPPELSGDPVTNSIAPQEFALSQRLPGLQEVVATERLVRRQAPMAHSVIGGQSSNSRASSAAVAQAIRQLGVTALNFDVPEPSRVVIRIYDRGGAIVRTLLRDDLETGAYAYNWDGTNDSGQSLPPGVYYAVMEAAAFSDRSKLILVR